MIREASASEAVSFVVKYHYTGTSSPGVLRYAWEEDGELLGISIYNNGTHAMCAGVFGKEYANRVLHHHRLAVAPHAPKFTAGKLIGASLRRIHKDRPDVMAVVTYADRCQDHHGVVYQATNALYTGMRAKGNLKFITEDGNIVPTQSLKGTWPERREEAARLGWREVRCKGKERYVYILGSKSQRRRYPDLLWPVLDYPK